MNWNESSPSGALYQMSDLVCGPPAWTARSGPLYLRWSGSSDARQDDGGALEFVLELAPGERHDLVLEISDQALDDPVDASRAWKATEAAWSAAVPRLGASLAPRESRHSYAVLTGLTSAGGGMVAAATTSLPERARAGRNYDYRYVWVRDQCYTGQAVAADGPHQLMDDAVAFVAARLLADGPQLKPAYTITGGPVPDEQSLSGLAGYPGAAVKIGNWVNQQFQLDALGEALMLFAAAAGHDHLDSGHWKAAEVAAAAIESRWGDPDAGIWELDNQHWTHSRLMCVAGLRAIPAAGAPARQARRWEALACTILADVTADGLHTSGRWQRAPAMTGWTLPCGPPGLLTEEYDIRQRQLRAISRRRSSTPCCSSRPRG